MGEIVAAGLLSHVPTIMLPKETRLELNDGREISIVTGLERLRKEKFETLDYDTVIVLDSHWFTTVEFVVTSQNRRAGLFTAEELCTIFAQTIVEIKSEEVEMPMMDKNTKVKEEPYGLVDFAKALQIVAHELYIEKQRNNMRYNCYNSSFLHQKVNKSAFCTNQLETMLDLTLWDDKI